MKSFHTVYTLLSLFPPPSPPREDVFLSSVLMNYSEELPTPLFLFILSRTILSSRGPGSVPFLPSLASHICVLLLGDPASIPGTFSFPLFFLDALGPSAAFLPSPMVSKAAKSRASPLRPWLVNLLYKSFFSAGVQSMLPSFSPFVFPFSYSTNSSWPPPEAENAQALTWIPSVKAYALFIIFLFRSSPTLFPSQTSGLFSFPWLVL